MKLKYFAPVLAILLHACAIQVSEVTPIGVFQTADVVATSPPGVPATGPTATYPGTVPPASTIAPASNSLSDLNLSGRLIYSQGINGLWQIDMQTGEQTQLWQLPERGYLSGNAATSDGNQLVLAYASPPPEGTPQLGATDIYLAARDLSSMDLLLERTVQYESYSNPTISPDGLWLYYAHSTPTFDADGNITGVSLGIERVPISGGEAEMIIPNGQQPSISIDGSHLVYLVFDFEIYVQSLWIADSDGANARELVPGSTFFAMAGPHLSPDGSVVSFAASGEMNAAEANDPTLRDWLLSWLGAAPVQAHGPPWEIWTVPATGGILEQQTELLIDSPGTVWSPDGDFVALVHPGGVLLIGADEPRYLGKSVGHGEIIWVPGL